LAEPNARERHRAGSTAILYADEVDDVERVLADSDSPSWLPVGSRVEIVQRQEPPRPMSLVRLLIRRGDAVFCLPREDSGKLDLPTRATCGGDVDGSEAIAALAKAVTGSMVGPVFLGAVRNIVPASAEGYAWPAPRAHFGIWRVDAAPTVDGRWIKVTRSDSPLRDRHWYPLIEAA